MKYYIVDAFAQDLFRGNQAGVCVLDEFLDSSVMQAIAAENNLSETAFVVPRNGHYDLKWFTPKAEIDLCGHATLATAFVVSTFVDPGVADMHFHTLSGVLTVQKNNGLFDMDFPSRMPSPIPVTPMMEKALQVPVLEAHQSRDLLLLIKSERQVQELNPDISLLSKFPGSPAVIVTAKVGAADFVSRFFAPELGVPEDPVTGSAHATLIPFWAERLNKQSMVARQLSARGGTLFCENRGDRVKISGSAVLYLQGEIMLPANTERHP